MTITPHVEKRIYLVWFLQFSFLGTLLCLCLYFHLFLLTTISAFALGFTICQLGLHNATIEKSKLQDKFNVAVRHNAELGSKLKDEMKKASDAITRLDSALGQLEDINRIQRTRALTEFLAGWRPERKDRPF